MVGLADFVGIDLDDGAVGTLEFAAEKFEFFVGRREGDVEVAGVFAFGGKDLDIFLVLGGDSGAGGEDIAEAAFEDDGVGIWIVAWVNADKVPP